MPSACDLGKHVRVDSMGEENTKLQHKVSGISDSSSVCEIIGVRGSSMDIHVDVWEKTERAFVVCYSPAVTVVSKQRENRKLDGYGQKKVAREAYGGGRCQSFTATVVPI